MKTIKSATSLYRQRAAQRGFTLIELLVVIAIIAVLMGMLMPAINAAREMAKRANCASNLHNMAAAIGNYSTQGNDALPMGIDPVNQTSGLVYLLPFMEANIVYKSYNFAAASSANSAATQKRIPILICPSDNPSGFFTSGAGNYAQSNYVLCFGGDTLNPASTLNQGAFKVGSTSTLAAITDGLSQTVMVSEVISEKDATTATKFDGAWGFGEAGACSYTHQQLPNTQTLGSLVTPYYVQSSAATLAGFASAVATASSRHPGGVNVAYFDHEAFEVNGQTTATWAAKGTAAGNENSTFTTAQ